MSTPFTDSIASRFSTAEAFSIITATTASSRACTKAGEPTSIT